MKEELVYAASPPTGSRDLRTTAQTTAPLYILLMLDGTLAL